MIELLYFLVCLFSTTIGAVSGIGGGVIIKPALDATGTMSVSAISFLSGCTLLSMATVSLIKGRKSEIKIDKRKTTSLAIGAALGGVVGKNVFTLVKTAFGNENHLGAIQAIILFIITAGVFVYVKKKESIKTLNVDSTVLCVIIGLLLGLISAFLGIGGGPINMAVLYFFFSMDTKTAAKNSIYIILFAQTTSFISTIVTNNVPEFTVLALVSMIVGGVSGGFLGSIISKKISSNTVEKIFTISLFIVMGINVFNIVNFLS